MTLGTNDLIISGQIIRNLTGEEQDLITGILDRHLAPNLWLTDQKGKRLFEISTETKKGADLHVLHGQLESRIKAFIELELDKKFEDVTDVDELTEINAARGERLR